MVTRRTLLKSTPLLFSLPRPFLPAKLGKAEVDWDIVYLKDKDLSPSSVDNLEYSYRFTCYSDDYPPIYGCEAPMYDILIKEGEEDEFGVAMGLINGKEKNPIRNIEDHRKHATEFFYSQIEKGKKFVKKTHFICLSKNLESFFFEY